MKMLLSILIRIGFVGAFGGLFLLSSSHAFAQADLDNYNPLNVQWNGLSELVSLSDQLKIRLTPRPALDYSTLDLNRPLLILSPLEQLDADNLEQFISRGGRVLLADDIGTSNALLSRFQLQRINEHPPSLSNQRVILGNPKLPLLEAAGVHPLLNGGVKVVAANHPAYILSPLPAVLYFDDRTHGLVFDLTVGERQTHRRRRPEHLHQLHARSRRQPPVRSQRPELPLRWHLPPARSTSSPNNSPNTANPPPHTRTRNRRTNRQALRATAPHLRQRRVVIA